MVYDENGKEVVLEWTLEDEIGRVSNWMQEVDPDSNEYKILSERLEMLLKMLDMQKKRDNEAKEKKKARKQEKKLEKKKRKHEREMKEKEIEAERKNTRNTVIATVAVGALSLAGTLVGIKATRNMHHDTLEFEQTNVPPRSSSKSFWKRLF